MAMPDIHGAAKYVGGLVGELGANTKLLNSFSNPKFPDVAYNDTICLSGHYVGDPPVWQVTDKEDIYFGGLVGVNNGLVENCYSRLQGDEPKSNVTTNGNYNKTSSAGLPERITPMTSSIAMLQKEMWHRQAYQRNRVLPMVVSTNVQVKDNSDHGTYDTTKLVSGKYGFNHRDQAVEATNSYVNNDTLIGGLQRALNAWVKDATNNGWNATSNTNSNGYAVWTRTMASTINDDYPVLEIADFNVVGTEDGVYMKYDTTSIGCGKPIGKNFQSLTSRPTTPRPPCISTRPTA